MNLSGDKEYYYIYNYHINQPELSSGTGTIPNLYYKIEF